MTNLSIPDITAEGWAQRSPLSARGRTLGPVTAAKQARTAGVYLTACCLGLVPSVLGLAPSWQAAGLGLLFPGAGFIAVGGWALLLIPLVMVLFAAALFAWFGAGMVIAPLIVWLGSAALAGALAQASPHPYAPLIGVTAVLLAGAWSAARGARTRRAGALLRAQRVADLPDAVVSAVAAATPRPAADSRELGGEELAAARYLLDRSLQPVEAFAGFDVVDQFQTAALRYQINHMGFGLAQLQANVTPNFHGYLSEAQRNLIEKYLDRRVWTYWLYETAWGHLNVRSFDPAARDNVMLTGWLGLHVGMYMLASGDRRYTKPGSLTFRLNERVAYAHDIHSLNRSVLENFETSAFCLYPCEPNWVYPICNHYGLASLAVSDRLFGASNTERVRSRWLESLDTEFTDESGSIVGLRSSLTGLRFPFPGGELGFAPFMNTFAPDRAWRMWATARRALLPALLSDERGSYLADAGPTFDFGNYRRSRGGAAAAILPIAREFGDDEVAAACCSSLDRFAGRLDEGGVLRFQHMSNLANISAAFGRFRRRDDFRMAVTAGPPPSALAGPILSEARYPDVLVAKAFSRGEDLDLVLYNGGTAGPQVLGLARLRPGRRYRASGAVAREFIADERGEAALMLPLEGRTDLHITPLA